MDAATKRLIVQKKFFGRNVQSFEIDGELLRVSVSNLAKVERFSVPLKTIDPEPSRMRRTATASRVAAVVLVAAAILDGMAALNVPADPGSGNKSGAFIFVAILLFAGAAFMMQRIRRVAVDALFFKNAAGARLPLWYNNPSREKFEDFVKTLQDAIKAAPKPQDQTLAGEIVKLKELFDQGILNKEQFEAAKNRLTGNEASKRVGF
jgi:hypothetical protein